ncbi:putative proline-tRNA ligase [Smittium culicis]|uniref:proline--tRNA ligase n=1 Tax=Smittium culicis TaxID=133412 RepID=A0A1R1YBW4_9FUNG|nr:putative proline-tRNA ligase [Smittium culicis]
MSDIQDLISQLTGLGLNKPVVSHESVDNVDLWSQALDVCKAADPSLQDQLSYVLSKCLILKPKQPKTAEPVQVFIIAKADTTFSMSNLGKDLKMKELRFANDDVLTSIFKTSKGNVSPFALSNVPSDKIASVTVILDQALVSEASTSDIAFHPLKNDKTLFISPATLKTYLDQLLGASGYKVLDLSSFAASEAAPAPAKKKAPVEQKPSQAAEEVGGTKLGLDVAKEEDFSRWYQQVLTRSEMLDYYDISGCYIIRPWAYHVWQTIQEYFDVKIKTMQVKNCYFPMFVSARALEQEKNHIEGFAPEVAWVTKAGSSDLDEPIAIRPTSETVMYPYFSKWIRSHRDLPLRLNQWCSVVRWEFKNPQPFLRTREFLWQEGHCAYLTKDDADTETRRILTYYKSVYEHLLAVPMIDGVKSEKEKFAGGLYTTTVEGFIPATGRGIQAATSHNLGQSFSKMFNVVVEDPNSPANAGNESAKLNVWQTSWGLSTRTLGVMVMVHGDNKGLVMPPRVSEIQVIVIPTGLTVKHDNAARQVVYDACSDLVTRLLNAGIRAEADLRDNYTPGFKYNHWELRGVPIRLEIGPKDLEKNSTLSVRRDTFAKNALPLENIETTVADLLEQIQSDMFIKATRERDAGLKTITKWDDFITALNNKCICLIPWCNTTECEDEIKERSSRAELGDEPQDEKAPSMGAKSLCIPFLQPTNPPIEQGVTKCIQCDKHATVYGLFGRSY